MAVLAAQCERRDAVLVIGQQVDGQELRVQRGGLVLTIVGV